MVHIVQILLVVTVVGLTVARLFIKGGQLKRPDTMALGMVRMDNQSNAPTNDTFNAEILYRVPNHLSLSHINC